AAEPIVFSSAKAAPAAGDWLGLMFGGIPNSANAMEFVRVQHAGATSTVTGGSCEPGNSHAAITLRVQPATRFITNTTVLDSSGDGINRGWTDPAPSLDFLPTNAFMGVLGCN